jgi:hypothetical protein
VNKTLLTCLAAMVAISSLTGCGEEAKKSDTSKDTMSKEQMKDAYKGKEKMKNFNTGG